MTTPLRVRVANPPIPPMKASLAAVVNRVLSRIPAASGACYLVRKDHIEITTGAAARQELGLPKWSGKEGEAPPPLRLVSHEVSKLPLEGALGAVADAGGYNVVLDARCEKQAE